jgi:amino acid transporter
MARWRSVAKFVLVAALAFWLGCIVMSAIVAGIVFSKMKVLNPTLPAYPAGAGDHWLIAGGQVALGVFAAARAAMFIVGGLSILILIVLGATAARKLRKRRSGLPLAAAILLLGCLVWNLGDIQPRMQENAHAYWASAEAGKLEEAAKYKAAFDADHPKSTRAMGVMGIVVLLTMVCVVWRGSRMERRDG